MAATPSLDIVVLLGGWSPERAVSLVTGRDCAKGLRSLGHRVRELDAPRDPAALLRALMDPRPDLVFNALHGSGGEDGRVQALLELAGLPSTHSGVTASAVAMDKQLTKRLVASHGVPIAEGHVVPASQAMEVMAPPFVIKPNAEGSSVGIHVVLPGDNRPPLEDWAYGEVLVERYVAGRELTVGVLEGPDGAPRALTVTEIRPREGFYDYAAKYTEGKAEHLLPAPLPPEIFAAACAHAEAAHRALGCRGVTRSDFRFDEAPGGAGLVFLEINTQPGMTPLSLVPEQAAHLGIGFPDLMARIVEAATR